MLARTSSALRPLWPATGLFVRRPLRSLPALTIESPSAAAVASRGFSQAAPGAPAPPAPGSAPGQQLFRERLLDGSEEVLTAEEKAEKDQLIQKLRRTLSGPLADENGNVPTGKDRPIAIEVDGPTHFYANSKRYTAYTKLKHRLLTRMGYKVLHVPYFDWQRLRGAKEREGYMRAKLLEEPSEWLDPEDEKYYNSPPTEDEQEASFRPEGEQRTAPGTTSAPGSLPPPNPGRGRRPAPAAPAAPASRPAATAPPATAPPSQAPPTSAGQQPAAGGAPPPPPRKQAPPQAAAPGAPGAPPPPPPGRK